MKRAAMPRARPSLAGAAAGAEPSATQVLAVRIGEQFQRVPVAQATVLVNATLVALVLGWEAPVRIWLAAMLAVAAFRLVGFLVHRRRSPAWSPATWARLHLAGALVNGVLWGALPILFFRPQAVAEHLFLSVVIVGMVAGSAAATIGHSGAFTAFTVPALAPLLFRLLGSSGALERAVGAMGVVFGVAMWALARAAARNWTDSLQHQLRNEALVGQLSETSRELARVNAGLEETVRRRTGELVEMERHLAQTALLASVGSLAAAVAHDINSPLAGLLSSVRMLEEETASSLVPAPPAVREALDDVRACADRVRDIVRSLGDVALVDARQGPLELRDIIDTCLAFAAPVLRGRVRLMLNLAESGRVVGERGSLSQVLLGLILHVVRAVPPGAPDVHELRVALRAQPGPAVAVEIWRDSVCPAADGAAAAGEDPGRGLALSTFQVSVAHLGGSLREREDGCGFVVELPVEPRSTEEPELG